MRGRGTVVLLHGLGRGGGSMRPLGRFLDALGYRTIQFTYASRRLPIDSICDLLHARLTSITGPVFLVTHSYGGIVAHRYLSRADALAVERVVMLAPPHGGSKLADLLLRTGLHRLVTRAASPALVSGNVNRPATYQLGIIAGTRPLDPLFPRLIFREPNDGKVTVAATRLDGMADHLVLPVSHTLMVWQRRVTRQVAHFLAHGRFTQS